MRVATSEDIPQINAILNDPSVIEGAGMGAYSELDISPVFENGILIMTPYGGFSFTEIDDRVFEAHMFFLPEGRGKYAINAAKKALQYMFSRGTRKVTARIPLEYKASRWITRQMGLKSVGTGPSTYGDCGVHESEFFEVDQCPL